MAAKRVKYCGLAGCRNALGPGAARVGFERLKKTTEVDVCSYHAGLITAAPKGTWTITDNFELKAIPAHPLIIDLKGKTK